MAVRRARRRRTYTTRRQRQSGYSYHKVITRGTTTLNSDNQIGTANLLTGPEAGEMYGKDLGTRGNSVVGLRGSWWWWTDATLDATVVQTMGWLSFGLISENVDQVAQIDTEAEQQQVGPLDLQGRYRPWHYRRTVPVMNRLTGAGTTDTAPIFDQAQQILMTRQGIGARRPEKFMSVRDSYFVYSQLDPAIDFDVGLAWQIQFFVKEP